MSIITYEGGLKDVRKVRGGGSGMPQCRGEICGERNAFERGRRVLNEGGKKLILNGETEDNLVGGRGKLISFDRTMRSGTINQA